MLMELTQVMIISVWHNPKVSKRRLLLLVVLGWQQLHLEILWNVSQVCICLDFILLINKKFITAERIEFANQQTGPTSTIGGGNNCAFLCLCD